MERGLRLLVAFLALAVGTAMCQAIGGTMYWLSLILILMGVPIGVVLLKHIIKASVQ